MFNVNKLKKVIIFGASGFAGSSLYSYFKANNICDVAGYSSRQCNLLDIEQVNNVFAGIDQMTAVIFCAGIKRSKEDSWDSMQKNITMIRNITMSIKKYVPRNLIFLSSVDVYGVPASSLPITEDISLAPCGYYALSKVASEYILRIENRFLNIPITILRFPGAYGKSDNGESLIGRFVSRIINRQNIEIYGDGSVRRDFISIKDFCRVVSYFLCNPVDATINVASGRSMPLNEWINLIVEISGLTPLIKYFPATAINGDLIFNINRLNNLCPGFVFSDSRENIKEYLEQTSPGGMTF